MENSNKNNVFTQEFNQLLKRMDNVYEELGKNSGISNTAFWILYTVRKEKETYKQKDLCDMWSYSKQTINSALKKLEEQNIIKLIMTEGNKKDKKIILTEKGEKIVKEFIDPVNEIEKRALESIEKKNEFLSSFRKYIEKMENETKKLQIRRQYENNFKVFKTL